MLDAGPLGLVTNPKLSAESEACAQWLQTHITSGSRIIIPEIADDEVRRELVIFKSQRLPAAAQLSRWNPLRSPLQWTLLVSPCFSYGRDNGYSVSLSAQ